MKDCFIGLYWGKREELVDECSKKILDTFSLFNSIDDSFIQWYQTTKPKKGQLVKPIEVNVDAIKNLLLNGRTYNDIDELVEDVGYIIYLKSFKDYSKSHVLSITCGSLNERIDNSIVLNISKAEEYSYLTNDDTLLRIYKRLSEIWNSEKGVINCYGEDAPILSEGYPPHSGAGV